MSALVSLHHNEPMTTSLAIAEGVEMGHKSVIQLVRKHVEHLSEFGTSAFEMRKSGGRYTEIAYLNEPQATLLLTFMRNSPIVIEFKKALVRAFFELRDQAMPHRGDPLSLQHRADVAVATDRTFRSWLRAGRAAGLPLSKALARANAMACDATGVDVLASLSIETEGIEANSVDRFIADWAGGELSVPYQVCTIRDLHNVYVMWCKQCGEAWPKSIIEFSKHLRSRPDIKVVRKHVVFTDRRADTPSVVMPSTDSMPEGALIQDWMASRIEQFREAMEELSG